MIAPAPAGTEVRHDVTGFADAVLALEALASAPYHQFVFDDPAEADALRRFLFERGVAEYSPPAALVLLADGRPAGLLAVLPYPLLRRRRLGAAAAIARDGRFAAAPALLERMRLASSTLGPVREDDLYLARVAVAPEAAGRGFGRWLVEQALDEARGMGARRCVLDVAFGNERAMGLYNRCGFVEVGRAMVEDAGTGRTLGHCHFASAL